MSDTLICASCGNPIEPLHAYSSSRGGPWHRLCIPPKNAERLRAPGEIITLTLDHNEAQAILNALRESGALDQKMIFHHVDTLRRKTERAMTAAGFPPIAS